MKTTANNLVGGIAIAIVLSARIAAAGSLCFTSPLWLGTAAMGQSAPTDSPTQNRGQVAADLLHRARQAMAENDLPAAEALISRAEALGVTYHPLYMGDTPKKVRRDLERKRNSAAAVPGKPSQLFSPMTAKRAAPKTDPFTGHTAETPAGASSVGQVPLLPKVDAASSLSAEGRRTMQSPSDGTCRMMEPGENDARAPGAGMASQTPADGGTANATGNSPLRSARRALAVGDVRRAMEFVVQAKGMRIKYQPLDDTPDKVEGTIRKYQDLESLDKNTEAYHRAYARNMLEQADALLRWGERDEAERLASQAAGMRIIYGPFEQKPQDMLERIAAARHQASASPATAAAARQQAAVLVRQARDAIAAGDFDRAEGLAHQAEQLQVPDSAYSAGEDRPGLVLLDLRQLRSRQSSGVVPAGGQFMAAPGNEPSQMAAHAVYDPGMDQTRNMQASNQQPGYGPDLRVTQNAPARPPLPPEPPVPSTEPESAGSTKPSSTGMALFAQGEAAMKARDTARAYDLFRQAATHMSELDAATAQRLQDNLQMLAAPSHAATSQTPRAGQSPTMADQALAKQQILAKSVASELAHKESNARAMRETDPKGALAMLEEARTKVESSGLDSSARDQLLRRVDRAIAETKQLIERNRPQIELAEKNKQTTQDIQRQERLKVEVGEKLALMVDEFNRLMEEQRYEQAEVVAKRAADLDPKNPVVVQLVNQARFVRNYRNQMSIKEKKEEGFVAALEGVDESSIPFADKNPLVFPDARQWEKISGSRRKLLADTKRQRSESEIEIEKKLRTPVSLQFTNAPLSKVLESLSKMADVNLHVDPQGLAQEGVTSDTPVTIDLSKEIMLKSALHLILEPLHLNYVVKDEVLKITSEQMRDGQVYTRSYNVADLVIPIPNFVPTQMGLASAYNRAMSNVNAWPSAGTPFGSGSTATPMAVVATKDGKGNNAMLNSAMLAQRMGTGAPMGPGGAGSHVPVGQGPGGLGGGAQADFDSLIELITSTVKPTTWDDVGGPGSIKQFETNLSLVISQTQDVHEEIEDLLQQLRRLQDLQVTIEVRFITLNDNFFERIGVSFDFDINDNVDGKGIWFGARQTPNAGASSTFDINQGAARNVQDQDTNRTVTVGMSSPTTFSSDLDIPFTQNSFGLAVPQFGGFDATAGAQLGFAILSDIEAYFFINAAQGDRRSNVLQAPKVTLFNGQQAYVSDTSQSPFVISVIPVVGDFAAAQQPVIVVLSEGTFMTVQAVVSNDKRFVRLTVVPFFSKIGDVNTFQFTGSQTTTTDTTRSGIQAAATDPTKLWNSTADNTTNTKSGTTVQLPTFSFVTVTTTVSVPDGGTVLLGGIKRLSEGRNEFGVPLLDKLPYINRLFKNVGIGRETQSLMMMVTPRIIIQEEEEEKLGVVSQGP